MEAPMRSEQVSPLVADVEAQKQRARLRESRAATNFAPPQLERLNETYIRPRQRYHAPDFLPKNDVLCDTCAGIDLSGLFRSGLEHDTKNGIRIRKGIPVGYSDEIYGRATCPFCRLLVEIGDSSRSGGDRDVEFWSIITVQGHEVLSSVAEPLHDIRNPTSDKPLGNGPHEAIYLALVRSIKPPPGYPFDYRTIFKDMSYIGLVGADELAPSADFSLRDTGGPAEIVTRIRGWLERCSKHRTCQARKTATWSCPDGFRLLDLTSLCAVETSGQEPYIALSYPWDQVDEFELKRDEPYVLDTLPGVMQDVIGVVKGLGLGINHIWIDRLCVDQEESVQKWLNLAAMGDIYGAAFATIILAVPSQLPSRGASLRGVPGLSAPRLPYQHVENVGKLKLANTLPSLEMAIATSLWNRRAWTFQEGILSSRCILLGPEQSYFECAEMGCWESLNEPDVAMSEQDHKIPYKYPLRNPFLSDYDFDSFYWRLVHDYTGRDMRFPSDSLNAFSAFTEEFKRHGKELRWGLPISDSALHLLWEHAPWDSREIHRRTDFPSWSWAGWNGTASMNFPLEMGLKACYTCTVREDSADGRTLSCTVRTAQVSIEGGFSMFSVVGAPGSSIMLDCGLNAVPECLGQMCVMMEICRVDDTVHGPLVQRRGKDYERIGSGFLKLAEFEAAGPDWQELRLV